MISYFQICGHFPRMMSYKYNTGRRISLKSLLHQNEHQNRIPCLKNRQNEFSDNRKG